MSDPNLEYAKRLEAQRRQAEIDSLVFKEGSLGPLFAKLKKDSEAGKLALAWLRKVRGSDHVYNQYGEWLSLRLKKSGFAQLIPGGIDGLPSLPEPPWYFHLFHPVARPRSTEHLLNHLYRYLPCYLDPEHVPQHSTSIRISMAGLLVITVVTTAILLALAGEMAIGFGFIVFLTGLAMVSSPEVGGGQLIKEAMNKIGLAWYLRQSYGDPTLDVRDYPEWW